MPAVRCRHRVGRVHSPAPGAGHQALALLAEMGRATHRHHRGAGCAQHGQLILLSETRAVRWASGWELPEWFWGSAAQTRHDRPLCLPVGAEPLRWPFCGVPALLSCVVLCCPGCPVLSWLFCPVLSCTVLCCPVLSCAVLAVPAVLCHSVPALLCCALLGNVGTCCRDAELTSGRCPNPCLVGHQMVLIWITYC